MEEYELQRGNFISYNGITVKFLSFVDDKFKKCLIQYYDGKTKQVPIKKLDPIEVDDEFLLNNGFHRNHLEHYADSMFHHDDLCVTYKTSINGFAVSSIKIHNTQDILIETVGDSSISHLQNVLTLAGYVDIARGLKVKGTEILDEEWITF